MHADTEGSVSALTAAFERLEQTALPTDLLNVVCLAKYQFKFHGSLFDAFKALRASTQLETFNDCKSIGEPVYFVRRRAA